MLPVLLCPVLAESGPTVPAGGGERDSDVEQVPCPWPAEEVQGGTGREFQEGDKIQMNGSPLEVRPGEREANAVVQMAHLLEFQYGAMIKVMEDMRERGVDVRGPLERAGLADFMEKVGLL